MSVLTFMPDLLLPPQPMIEGKRFAASFPFGMGKTGLHECVENKFGDKSALIGFVLANTNSIGGVLFVQKYSYFQEFGCLFAASLSAYSWSAQDCLTTVVSKNMDALWAIEEGIKSRGVGLIIAEVETADFTATRRLKLASERYGVPVVLVMPYTREGSSACEMRWRISPQPSAINPYDSKALGNPRWRAEVERCRVAPERVGEVFDLEYDDETLSLRVVSRMVPRSVTSSETSKNSELFSKIKKTR